MNSWDQFPARWRWIYGDEEFRARLARYGLAEPAALSSPDLGRGVTGGGSSWVRLWECPSSSYYIKTYDYPTWRARGRGVGRNTLLATSRPRREQQALDWLRARGFGGPRVRAVVEARVLGFLRRGVLVTDSFPGEDMARLLPSLPESQRQLLLDCLFDFVRRLHEAGFRDRNLDLRNLLAHRDGDSWAVVKIDSPRFRLVTPGRLNDALARADWQRLGTSLQELGLEAPMRP